MGKLFQNRNSQVGSMVQVDSITLGTVIDTNDPHQMGRLKILCPALGDDPNDDIGTQLPWANYISPTGGMVNSTFSRGPNEGNQSAGPIAYGMWGIPKRGATVLVCCVDGDPYYRVWIGSLFDQGSVNTLPHGRYFYRGGAGGSGAPEGPLDSYETPIEPLYSNLTQAFTKREHNYEWRTRGADYSVAGNSAGDTEHAPSNIADETDTKSFASEDGKSFDIQNGYATNRMDGKDDGDESSVYSWTSPGFHSISMDDRPESCRVKIRSTSGSQIILDDTNERIYINTARGNNWVEMDWNGNIDMHGRMLSFHADTNINFTADDSIRFFANNGIHAYSNAEINFQATGDISSLAGGAIRQKSGGSNLIQSDASIEMKATTQIVEDAPMIQQNGASAQPANANKAKWTMRIPTHEPFARVVTKADFSHDPEFQYDDPSVGLQERGQSFARGKFWRR